MTTTASGAWIAPVWALAVIALALVPTSFKLDDGDVVVATAGAAACWITGVILG